MRMATAQHVWREAAAAPFRREQVVRMILSDQHDRSATTTSRRGRRWRWPELQPPRPDVLAQERQRVLVGVCPSPGRLPARGPAVAIAAAAATEGAATVCTSPPASAACGVAIGDRRRHRLSSSTDSGAQRVARDTPDNEPSSRPETPRWIILGIVNLLMAARSCPVKSTLPIVLSRRTSPHPIQRTRGCGAGGGDPTAGGVARLERDSAPLREPTRTVGAERPT